MGNLERYLTILKQVFGGCFREIIQHLFFLYESLAVFLREKTNLKRNMEVDRQKGTSQQSWQSKEKEQDGI